MCVCACLLFLGSGTAFAFGRSPVDSAIQGSSKAPESPKIVLNAEERTDFASAFEAISGKARVTILAEGAPFRARLTANQLAELATTLPVDKPADLKDVIAKVALAYDYDAECVGAHEFLLRKRYTEPGDLPCVTYEEVLHSLREILRLTSAVAPPDTNGSESYAPERLYRSLNPEQKAKAGKGIAMADLTPEQRQIALTAIGDVTLGVQALPLKHVVDHLSALQEPHTVFTHMTVSDGVAALGYRMPGGKNESDSLFPLNHRFQINAVNWSHPNMQPNDPMDFSKGFRVKSGVGGIAPSSDPTVPTDGDRRLAHGMRADSATNTVTLADFARTLTAESEDRQLSVAPGVGEKTISVFGQPYSNADELVRSVVALYRLQLLAPHPHEYAIVLPMEKDPKDNDGFHDELLRLIPAPLARILARVLAPQRTPIAIVPSRSFKAVTLEDYEYYPAIRQLLLLAEPRVPNPDSPPVPVAQIGPEALRLLAIAQFAGDGGNALQNLSDYHLPAYLANPESLVVAFTMNRSMDKYEVLEAVLGFGDGSGAFYPQTHVSYMRTKGTMP